MKNQNISVRDSQNSSAKSSKGEHNYCFAKLSLDEKKELATAIKVYVSENELVPPLSVDELKIHADKLMICLPQLENNQPFTMILLNNSLWEEIVSAIPFERRILLLPQCLKHPSKCKADSDEFGLLCQQCGECLIGEFQEEGEKLGYVVLVAEGTSLVTKLIESGKIDAVIGVSCIHALEKAFTSISAHAIPSIAIPLNSDGCIGTDVDSEVVLSVIARHSDATGAGQVDINGIKATVTSWFEKEVLSSQLYNGQDKIAETEEIAFDWLSCAGKRWRPFLTAAVYSALTEPGKPLSDIIIKPALSVEAFHKASLIHDDIEDNDNLRYGEKTMHCQYGIPIALNIGDLLIGEGYRFIGEAELPKSYIAKMLTIASSCHRTLSLGQGAELLAVKNMKRPLVLKDIKAIFQSKTSPAFEAALAIGAACAGADDEIFPILKAFSKALGMAYQIKDDIEDLDEIDDLPTHASFCCSLLFSIAYENGSAEEKQTLCAFLQESKDAQKCIPIISSTKTLDRANQLYEHYKNKAIRSLSPLKNAPLKSFLRKIIQKICN